MRPCCIVLKLLHASNEGNEGREGNASASDWAALADSLRKMSASGVPVVIITRDATALPAEFRAICSLELSPPCDNHSLNAVPVLNLQPSRHRSILPLTNLLCLHMHVTRRIELHAAQAPLLCRHHLHLLHLMFFNRCKLFPCGRRPPPTRRSFSPAPSAPQRFRTCCGQTSAALMQPRQRY